MKQKSCFNFITTKLHFQYFVEILFYQASHLGTQMYSNTVFNLGFWAFWDV